ncbi:MAG: ACP S-malonyltransferase [Candidatus Marinimicrobia bacterium]|nr:ACP S-malonyltransferase [Candidatus Neomarinimicrobiota bacterium]RKY62104.1 MAG: [acyl-carrier-protein] S-malonyltransferase [Candidatus Neomarinimicrobiota bacterium]
MKTAFVFPGQASQFVGMGLDLYNSRDIARQYYDRAAELFDFPIKDLSFYGPLVELTQTRVTQPAIYIHSMILFEELKKQGKLPDMVAGHSLGEYSALTAAGVVDFEQGLKLVKIRSEQMQIATENNSGTMAAIVGLDYDTVQAVLDKSVIGGVCNIANYNSPNQIVISGDVHTVQSTMLALKEAGAKRVIELSVGGAFHSSLMQSAGEELKKALDRATFDKPAFPIYSNVTGTATTDIEKIRDRLYRQLTSPVLWVDTIENMIKDGAENFVEIGPGKVLQGIIKRINSKVRISGISNVEDLENIE